MSCAPPPKRGCLLLLQVEGGLRAMRRGEVLWSPGRAIEWAGMGGLRRPAFLGGYSEKSCRTFICTFISNS